MGNIAREVSINCPPSDVYALLTEVERLPEFSDMTVAVKNGPGRPLRVGDRFDQVVKLLGVEVDTEWEVTEMVQDCEIRIEGRSKANGRASLTHLVRPDDTGCVVRLEVDYDPPFGILGEIADKLVFEQKNEEDAERILGRLRALCEGTPAK